MVSSCADNPNSDPIAFIPAGVAIYHVDSITGIEIVYRSFTVDLPDLCQESEKGDHVTLHDKEIRECGESGRGSFL